MPNKLEKGHFYGQTVYRERLRDAILTVSDYQPGFTTPFHEHEMAYFTFLLKGDYSEKCGVRHVDLKPYSVVFHNAGDRHDGGAGFVGARCFFVEIGANLLDRVQDVGKLPEAFADPGGGDPSWLALRLYRSFMDGEPQSPLVMEGLLMEMLAASTVFNDRSRRQPPWLNRARELIHDEWNQNLGVADIAQRVGVHPVHLSRVFRRFYKQGIMDYIQRLRIRNACLFLEHHHESLAQLALELGFADQSHFTRIFRRLVGKTPARYRQMAGHSRP